jgi:hypothetical protein
MPGLRVKSIDVIGDDVSPSGVVYYHLLVTLDDELGRGAANASAAYVIRRRFSQVHAVHEHLSWNAVLFFSNSDDADGPKKTPRPPPKHAGSFQDRPFVEQRKHELAAYFARLLMAVDVDLLMTNERWLQFLQPDDSPPN